MGDQSVNLLSCNIFTSYVDKVEMSMNTDYKFIKQMEQEAIVIASTSPVILALSSFKRSDRAIDMYRNLAMIV